GHWFDGDGMVQAFTFTGDGVRHRARIMDTPKRRRETAAGTRLLPAFGTLPPDVAPFMAPDDMNAANTSVLVHGGRLMALWEGGSALEFDPETLAAGDFVSWRPDLAGAPFSAHPKVEADGTCWNIGCVTFPRPLLLFYRIDPQGRLAAFNALPVEPLGMVHDYVVTRRHLVLVISPFVVEPERFAAGPISFLDAHVWRPELGTRVIVVGKETLAPVRRYDLPPGFHFHHGNGWEEADGTIHLDVCQAADPMFAIHDLRAVMEGDWKFPSAHPHYRRIVLRPGGTATVERVAPHVADFPRIDPRRTGLRHRALFALTGARGGGWPLSRIDRIDPDQGAVDGWTYPRHLIPEEHVLVPRGAADGDGWLVGPFLDLERGASGLSVFDAHHLADGPLWQGILHYPLPLGLHGTFVVS
ncbi:MAG: carotenoid oxygenase family protein, partial [Rhodospirillaceae bacterium]|nr:carotenoid oxygenase family protein [Rhodospirillaceae bacterium]